MTKLARFLQFFAVVFISMKLLAVAESQFPLTKYFERRKFTCCDNQTFSNSS